MNRLIVIIAFLAFSMSEGIAQKFGYINSQELISLLPEVQEANSEIEVMKGMFSKKGQEMVAVLRTKYQDLQKKQASGEIAPMVLEKEAATLKAEEQKIAEFEQSSQQKVVQKSEELYLPIQEKVNTAIKEVAAENGFLYIFDMASGIVIYADESTNVTTLVKTKLGIKI
ncbi:MAG: OmpH family outer membrane protein [Saprospiraceae bacterium]|nr:OmpH family outer membrane protein [Saprospiraceae bacterium]